jgi:hypothetical protein
LLKQLTDEEDESDDFSCPPLPSAVPQPPIAPPLPPPIASMPSLPTLPISSDDQTALKNQADEITDLKHQLQEKDAEVEKWRGRVIALRVKLKAAQQRGVVGNPISTPQDLSSKLSFNLQFVMPSGYQDVAAPHKFDKKKPSLGVGNTPGCGIHFPHHVRLSRSNSSREYIIENRTRVAFSVKLTDSRGRDVEETALSKKVRPAFCLSLVYADDATPVKTTDLSNNPSHIFGAPDAQICDKIMNNGKVDWAFDFCATSDKTTPQKGRLFKFKVVCTNTELAHFNLVALSVPFRACSRLSTSKSA